MSTDSAFLKPRVNRLPRLELTRVSSTPVPERAPVDYQRNSRHIKYWREPISPSSTRSTNFRSFPLVLDGNGEPWAPAIFWLLDRAQAKPWQIESLLPIAQDLAAYKAFLEEAALDWDDFSASDKYARPTYLYHLYLSERISHQDRKRSPDGLRKSTASRRMSSVIGMYRFLMRTPKMNFYPANDPWVEEKVGIVYRDGLGLRKETTVTTTDVSIKNTKYEDAWNARIADGGNLRPLPVDEQRAVVAALKALGNVEYALMHYIALATGAREATVLTLRLRDFQRPTEQIKTWPHKILCGPGTGIDTKRNATGVYLVFPKQIYKELHAYAVSSRARNRRARTALGEDPVNYLFLTKRARPYYESKDDRNAARQSTEPLPRSAHTGWALRKFIQEKVIPEVRRANPELTDFSYRFHDLRATFGMNWVDFQMQSSGEDFGNHYLLAREQLRKIMWHRQSTTTDKYLNYRHNMHHLKLAQQGWNDHLIALISGHAKADDLSSQGSFEPVEGK